MKQTILLTSIAVLMMPLSTSLAAECPQGACGYMCTCDCNDAGLVTSSYNERSGKTTTYTYDGNMVIKKEGNPGQDNWVTTIATYENPITSMQQVNCDPKYSTTYNPYYDETSKFMKNSDENGNSLSYVNASFDADGNIKYIATIYEPYTKIDLTYKNGKIVEQVGLSPRSFNINYDEETGKPVSREGRNGIVETYDFTSDGKLKICDAQGQNCETTQYSSLEDYFIAPFAAVNLTDVFDSDFGTKGYIPSRLKQQNSDGSTTIFNEDGTIKGFKNKRIYTIDEANQVAGAKNRVSIRYR
ncbi:MAG: hypothetical protein IJ830_02885 [Alphaproteobacteria bacterium]|nr:hypothetical protein [Alphaproteobacteria bacterium]